MECQVENMKNKKFSIEEVFKLMKRVWKEKKYMHQVGADQRAVVWDYLQIVNAEMSTERATSKEKK